jgi:hypothetical protein
MADLDRIYIPASSVVAREIEGELILIPITADVADMEEDIFTLNVTGRAIWEKLDGRNTLRLVVDQLLEEYGGTREELISDVIGFMEALLSRNIAAEA